MSYQTRTNNYKSSNSSIVYGPGTMYNEITRPKPIIQVYNKATNSYDVTTPYIYVSKTKNSKNKSK